MHEHALLTQGQSQLYEPHPRELMRRSGPYEPVHIQIKSTKSSELCKNKSRNSQIEVKKDDMRPCVGATEAAANKRKLM